MMPRTANGVVNHGPVCKRPVIEAAVRIASISEPTCTRSTLISDMTKQLAFGKFSRPHVLRQIGAAWPLFFTHNSFSFSAYSSITHGEATGVNWTASDERSSRRSDGTSGQAACGP